MAEAFLLPIGEDELWMNTLKIKYPIWTLDFFASFLQSIGHFDPLKTKV